MTLSKEVSASVSKVSIYSVSEVSVAGTEARQLQGVSKEGLRKVEKLDASEESVRRTLNRYKKLFVRIDSEWGLISNK